MGAIGKCCCAEGNCLCDPVWHLSEWKIDDIWGMSFSGSYEPSAEDKSNSVCFRKGSDLCRQTDLTIIKSETKTTDWSSPSNFPGFPPISCPANCSANYAGSEQDYPIWSIRAASRMDWMTAFMVSVDGYVEAITPTTFRVYMAVFYEACFFQVVSYREQSRIRVERRTCVGNTLLSDTGWLQDYSDIDLNPPVLGCNAQFSPFLFWPFPASAICPPSGYTTPSSGDCYSFVTDPVSIERLNASCDLVTSSISASDLQASDIAVVNDGGPNNSARSGFYDHRSVFRGYVSPVYECNDFPEEIELDSSIADAFLSVNWGTGGFNFPLAPFTPPAFGTGGITVPRKIWVRIS